MRLFRTKKLLLILLPVAAIGLFFGAVRGGTRLLERRYPPPGRLIPVGDHKLHLYCTGSGSPTVVLDTGIGLNWISFQRVATELAATNRVCVYDRAGYGWSDPGPMPRTAQQCAIELHALLAIGNVPGPYVLVGHSFGAYVARAYASRYPATLAGIVLAEPSHEDDPVGPAPPRSALGVRDLTKWVPPLGIDRLKRLYQGESLLPAELRSAPAPYRNRYIMGTPLSQLAAESSELRSRPEHQAQMRAATFPPDLPLAVITAVRPGAPPLHYELHERLAHLSSVSQHLIAERSGHVVQLTRPDLIVAAVRGLHRPTTTARLEPVR